LVRLDPNEKATTARPGTIEERIMFDLVRDLVGNLDHTRAAAWKGIESLFGLVERAWVLICNAKGVDPEQWDAARDSWREDYHRALDINLKADKEKQK
jgi:hypothetical protein